MAVSDAVIRVVLVAPDGRDGRAPTIRPRTDADIGWARRCGLPIGFRGILHTLRPEGTLVGAATSSLDVLDARGNTRALLPPAGAVIASTGAIEPLLRLPDVAEGRADGLAPPAVVDGGRL